MMEVIALYGRIRQIGHMMSVSILWCSSTFATTGIHIPYHSPISPARASGKYSTLMYSHHDYDEDRAKTLGCMSTWFSYRNSIPVTYHRGDTLMDLNMKIDNEEEEEDLNLEEVQWMRLFRQAVLFPHRISDNQYRSITDEHTEEPFKENYGKKMNSQTNSIRPCTQMCTHASDSSWRDIADWATQDVDNISPTVIREKCKEFGLHPNLSAGAFVAYATRYPDDSHRLNLCSTEEAHGKRIDCPDIDALQAHAISPGNPMLAAHLAECVPCRSEFQILKDTLRIAVGITESRDNLDNIFSGICYEPDEGTQGTDVDDDENIDCEPCRIFMQMEADYLRTAVEGAVSRDADIDGHIDASADNQSSQSVRREEIVHDCITS